MRFDVVFTEASEQEFLSLPKSIQRRIKDAITKKLQVDPISFGKPLRYSWKGHRSLRVGDYRIIYKVEEEAILVEIIKIDIRRDVYEI
jgi:mRNA interferase RelE/StbE